MNNHYYRRKLQSIFSFEDQIVLHFELKGVPCKRKESATDALLCLTTVFNLEKVQYTEELVQAQRSRCSYARVQLPALLHLFSPQR